MSFHVISYIGFAITLLLVVIPRLRASKSPVAASVYMFMWIIPLFPITVLWIVFCFGHEVCQLIRKEIELQVEFHNKNNK